MSALTALIEALARAAGESGGKGADKVGAEFLSGAARPGTFQRGRDFAQTPEGLAQQFDWGKLEPLMSNGRADPNTLRAFDPNDPTSAAFVFKMTPEEVKRYSARLTEDKGTNGYTPFVEAGLPEGEYHSYDTGAFTAGSGAGKRAYPSLYGNTLLTPDAFNIKDMLTGANAYRNNYALGNAIMRQPNAGERLLASPEQFQHLPVDVAALRTAGPERQVGSLQTEGALQTLRRLNTAAGQVSPALSHTLQNLPLSLTSSMSPSDLQAAFNAIQASRSTSLQNVGPAALRKLGIVQDVLTGRPVDPTAFKQLEFKEGGLATCHRCGML